MKRSGFTMIELIFVIVILGILAAVALPKFIGVSEQAQVGKFKAYAGTMGRTTLAPYWGAHLTDGTGGVLVTADMTSALSDLPMIGEATSIAFTVPNLEAAGFAFYDAATGTHTAPTATSMADIVVGTGTYSLHCSQGDMTNAPACNIWDGTNNIWLIQ